MMSRPTRLLLPAILAGLLVLPAAAPAALLVDHLADDAALALAVQEIAFVAEGRIGDRAGAATFELDLGQTDNPTVTKQYGWVSGQVEPFSLVYDAGLNTVTYTLGGQVLVIDPGVAFDVIVVRTRATQAGSDIAVQNLVLNGEAVGDVSFADGDGSGLDLLRIRGGSLAAGFTLTGEAVLTWGAILPANSHLAFQVKVGSNSPTPVEEETWGRVKVLFAD
jgi:hypothetical protein